MPQREFYRFEKGARPRRAFSDREIELALSYADDTIGWNQFRRQLQGEGVDGTKNPRVWVGQVMLYAYRMGKLVKAERKAADAG